MEGASGDNRVSRADGSSSSSSDNIQIVKQSWRCGGATTICGGH